MMNEDVLVQAFERGLREALGLPYEPGRLKNDLSLRRVYARGLLAGNDLRGPFPSIDDTATAWLQWAAPLERCSTGTRSRVWDIFVGACHGFETPAVKTEAAVVAALARRKVYVGPLGEPRPDTAQARLEWELALTLAFQPREALAVVCIAAPSGDLLFAVQREGQGATTAVTRGVLALEDPVHAVVQASVDLMARCERTSLFRDANPEVVAALFVTTALDAQAKAPLGPCPRCGNRGVVIDETSQVRREVPCLNGCLAPRVRLVSAGQA